jgi:formylmethanofuran dehydrogenase subunit E
MQDLIQRAITFHGHSCPGLAIGCRVAQIAQRELDFKRAEDEEILAICESDACALDAIQALTGCTVGKGNLIFRDWGKMVFTFGRRRDGKAIRIALRYNALQKNQKLSPDENRQAALELLKTASDKDLFDIRWTEISLPKKARIFNSICCSRCGEGVMEARARLCDEKPVYPECYGPTYSRGW